VLALGSQTVLSAGVASATILNSGGHQLVSAGGVASLTAVASGGVATVYSGGGIVSASVRNGGSDIVSSGGTARFSVVSSGGKEYVSAGGTATGTTVQVSGTELVYGKAVGLAVFGSATVFSGGNASAAVISGGTLQVNSGGAISVNLAFAGSGGELILESPTLPTTTISGFAAGDTIQLAGVTYASGATVSVLAAGVVTISDGGKAYKLDIAGATVGETDFQFSSGSLLTRGSTPGVMKFIGQPISAALAPSGVTGHAAASLFAAIPAAVAVSAASAPVASASRFGGADGLLTAVSRGGTEISLFGHPRLVPSTGLIIGDLK
jgi:autotransporter passenger strand-loop-strand repeat protein